MTSALLAGLGLCLSLIIAPGAQNVFLLKMGIRRQHVVALAVTCLVSDIVLIAFGVAGFGMVVEELPWVFDVVRWAGVVFLLGYAFAAGWRAIRPKAQAIDVTEDAAPGGHDAAEGALGLPSYDDRGSAEPGRTGDAFATVATAATATIAAPDVRPGRAPRTASTLVPALLMCLAITWLNPHTYLDTVLLLGSVSAGYGDGRWLFGIGAVLGSAIWFAFLTVAARYAARWLRSPLSWRILDAAIAIVMLVLATGLMLA